VKHTTDQQIPFAAKRPTPASVLLPHSASTNSLCQECGLCCDGTLFDDVELKDRKESLALEAMGLEVDEEDGRQLLIQPCRALNGTCCTVYPHRPDCCRTFECALLIRHQSGQLTKENALAKIQQVKHLAEAGQITEALTQIEQHFLTLPQS